MCLTADHEIHATLLVVFGRGLLLTGPAGIGKSTLALQLAERGHALVVDDSPRFERRGNRLHGLSRNGFEGLLHLPGAGLIDLRQRLGSGVFVAESPVDLVVDLQNGEGREGWSPVRINNVTLPRYRLPVTTGLAGRIEALIEEKISSGD